MESQYNQTRGRRAEPVVEGERAYATGAIGVANVYL